MQNMKETYPMGIPYCGYASMGMPASEIRVRILFT